MGLAILSPSRGRFVEGRVMQLGLAGVVHGPTWRGRWTVGIASKLGLTTSSAGVAAVGIRGKCLYAVAGVTAW